MINKFLGVGLDPDLHQAVNAELERARTKFPDSEGAMCALTEEVGELAKALLDESPSRIKAEGIQVICMVVRLLSEGDRTLDSYRAKRGQVPTGAAA